MKKRDIQLVIMLLCCVSFCACNNGRERTEIVSDSEAKEDITEESTEMDRMAKGYDLPVSDSERKEAEDDCKEMMGLISELYKNADKGYADNVIIADEVIDQMVEKLKSAGCPVTVTVLYSNMENYKELEDFLNASIAGRSGSAVYYEIHSDGGVGRYKYIYDGKDMYILSEKAAWSDDDKPVITYISYTRIEEWKFTDKGWFCYELCVPEYPEVTEIVDGSCMVRVKPITEKNREMSERSEEHTSELQSQR